MLVTIMTDASVDSRLQVGGFGYWIASDRGKIGGGGGLKSPVKDSYAGELKAVVNSLHIAIEKQLVQERDTVLIQLDNLGVVTLLKERTEPPREDIAQALNHFISLVDRLELVIYTKHVKGHSDSTKGARFASNNHCDVRARDAMLKKRKNKVRNNKRNATNGA